MENKSGENKDNRDNWFENAEDGVEQELFADVEEAAEPKEDEAENLSFDGHAEQEKNEEAEALQEDDDRELKETPKEKKKWMLLGMAAIFVIALTAFLFSDRFYNMIRGRSSYVLQKMEQTVAFAEGNTSVLVAGDYLLRCSQDGLQALDEKGKVIWDVPFTMSSPYMLKAGNYISVADRLGTSVMLIKNGVVETEIDAENQILLQCVNEQGASVAVLDGEESHDVKLYSSDGEVLMQRHTYADKDGIPVAIALNADGSRMATAYIHYTGTKIQSIVTVFDLTESGSALVDRIVGSVAFEDCVIADLKFDGELCFFAGSDRFGAVEANRTCEIVWEKQLEYQMETLILSDDYFAVRYGEGMAGTVAAAENNVVVYNYNGKVLCSESLEGATYLDAWGDTVIYGAGRSYYGISPNGSPKWQFDAVEDYSRLVAFESGDTVAAVRNGEIGYFKVSIKGAKEAENE
ncbi:MAG: hypothetical protein IJN87_09335 [Firmicutes bacterium]|nr:hypothetical protein [Bacillota bacterium]